VKQGTAERYPKRSNAFMPVSKAEAFGRKNTSKLACMFQQGTENISSMLPQSFYGVERAQGQEVRLALSLFSPWPYILGVQADAFCLAPAEEFKDLLLI